ncbi:MAG: TIGR03761 family integrating conjugative element protein [Gammaproteobacteria bacterium CG11_big_fil_rev_8_21_14_0_20_46_22]|nr:MAG: TIGR03761 family integrating conjugative element protein [Gammaproteobacteria bacterium CG12_big_fil_rev_8_21_14_0_65_46_12]PIR11882.1 MAG: TIGR03761 family integrating conjugative element protein [Gammaproteobacteria bacterium CG11_big_fil_rev_8_21_14_0_20_46_22]
MSQANDTQLSIETKPQQNNSSLKKPARLTGNVKLTLHTSAAQQLFIGTKEGRKRTTDLLQFGGRMTEIWLAAKKDNPYADWFLLRAYDRLAKVRQQLLAAVSQYRQQLESANQKNRLDVELFTSSKPSSHPLRFGTQYGFLGGSLIADYDELMRILLTARQIGILFDEPYSVIQQAWKKQIIELFRLPFQWAAFSVTRLDVEKNNDNAKAAEAKMGKLPKDVIEAKIRSPFAPIIIPAQEATDQATSEDKKDNPQSTKNNDKKNQEQSEPAPKLNQSD